MALLIARERDIAQGYAAVRALLRLLLCLRRLGLLLGFGLTPAQQRRALLRTLHLAEAWSTHK